MNRETKQIKNIANIQSGLVLARKGAKQIELIKADLASKPSEISAIKYKVLTQKAFSYDGITIDLLDDFDSTSHISQKYLTQEGDVIIKLFEPIISCYITNQLKDMIIPSQFAIIRVEDKIILPEFLNVCLGQDFVQKQFKNTEASWQLRNIKTSSIGEVKISIPPIQDQQKIIEIAKLQKKQYNLKKELLELENSYNKLLIEKIITKGEYNE